MTAARILRDKFAINNRVLNKTVLFMYYLYGDKLKLRKEIEKASYM